MNSDGIINYDSIHMSASPDLSIPGITEQPEDFIICQGHRIGTVGSGPPLLPIKKGIILGQCFDPNSRLRSTGREQENSKKNDKSEKGFFIFRIQIDLLKAP